METTDKVINSEFNKSAEELSSQKEKIVETVQNVKPIYNTQDVINNLDTKRKDKYSKKEVLDIISAYKKTEEEAEALRQSQLLKQKEEEERNKATQELVNIANTQKKELDQKNSFIVTTIIEKELSRLKDEVGIEFNPNFYRDMVDKISKDFRLLEINGESKAIHKQTEQPIFEYMIQYHKDNLGQFLEVVNGMKEVSPDTYEQAETKTDTNEVENKDDPRNKILEGMDFMQNYFNGGTI